MTRFDYTRTPAAGDWVQIIERPEYAVTGITQGIVTVDGMRDGEIEIAVIHHDDLAREDVQTFPYPPVHLGIVGVLVDCPPGCVCSDCHDFS